MKRTTLLVIIPYLMSITSCQHSPYYGKLNTHKLIPFSVKYIEGDDGLQTYSLQIDEKGGRFSVREIMTDNYTNPVYFDTSYISLLNDSQILAAREFLIAIPTLPKSCEQSTSLTQKLVLNTLYDNYRVEGNCSWGNGSYWNLRKKIFGK